MEGIFKLARVKQPVGMRYFTIIEGEEINSLFVDEDVYKRLSEDVRVYEPVLISETEEITEPLFYNELTNSVVEGEPIKFSEGVDEEPYQFKVLARGYSKFDNHISDIFYNKLKAGDKIEINI